MKTLGKEYLDFLSDLSQNNNKIWFAENKLRFDSVFAEVKSFFKEIYDVMQQHDHISLFHTHRIYRDVRFSKDKTPYKNYFGLHLGRAKPLLRGGYYLSLEPGKSFVGGGFWEPNNIDLLRIRKEIEMDDRELRDIISEDRFKQYFDELKGEELKTAPKGFDKGHPSIDLLRKKQFLVMRSFTDKEVMKANFLDEVIATFIAMRPFFDYMSAVLTTDVNGVSLFDSETAKDRR
ncbi:Conserved hypothetical protein CHP02453 [Pseudopedobacter saltans DSM 12145]|uniref:TIGR02453 family protein n=1 Tax=Pseudopedobacter saltans (strain ATCC 51119 / DSM 12145 / JCM 21818 / CCUG 39354 / LMG 10337 / NBRC 100064 / NCIMB 13643) TaxID=762903 RepID=F0SA24_PSESL|nr:DUF2461 domain-containing protein [Pseudopedobacter saltans]ADY53588.1 Conserved hypothetical protein CHP02453 [Pseudopedobacter saltans DSM 12145]